jgi:hypothetical protein
MSDAISIDTNGTKVAGAASGLKQAIRLDGADNWATATTRSAIKINEDQQLSIYVWYPRVKSRNMTSGTVSNNNTVTPPPPGRQQPVKGVAAHFSYAHCWYFTP